MSVQAAFNAVCTEAKPAIGAYVSLYVRESYYGGPEEGGWWGDDVKLLASQWFPTEQAADEAKARVDVLADELSVEARRAHGNQCLRETEWLEARGLDDSFLPEPAGEDSYMAVVETTAGSMESIGCRHYE